MQNFKNIDEYIALFPKEVKEMLLKVRETIISVAPDATEAIAYGIPTYKLDGKNLVHFAGFKKHIGFYPTPSGIETFKDEVAPYNSGKGTLQFPLDKPLPLELIKKVVKYRVSEVTKKV